MVNPKYSRIHLFMGAAFATLTISSHAAFTVEDESRATRVAQSSSAQRAQAGRGEYIQILGGRAARRSAISQVGVPDESIPVVTGFGKDLPFATGLSQIVPRGWQGFAEDARMKSIGTISWEGGRRPWITVLNEVMLDNGLHAKVDWDTKEIMFSLDSNAEGQPAGRGNRTEVAAAPVAPQKWTLEAGKTLRTNLEEWTKKAGWSLSWGPEDVDYNITAGVELTGDLAGENGAITQVISKYRTAGRPLTVKYYNGNMVVRIEERVSTQVPVGR